MPQGVIDPDDEVDLAQQVDPDEVRVPPFLYVPVSAAQPESGEQAGEIGLELRQTVDGGLVLLTFTALDRLIDGCGEHQPWVVIPAERLADIKDATGVTGIVLDVGLPEELRHGHGGGDAG